MSNLTQLTLLAIDTSGDACSVALYVAGELLESYEWAPKAHTRLLLPMIDELLKERRMSLPDLDAFAFGQGPGSFTGIRIACSVIQALSFGLSKPVIPISTLRAIAQGAYRELGVGEVLVKLDARMQEVYWGLFKVNVKGIMEATMEERLGSPKEVILPPGTWHTITGCPHAKDIAVIAAFEYERGNWVSAVEALPIYLRETVAKKPLF